MPAHADYVAARLTNAEALRKAKILPFQLYTAYRMFEVEDARRTAIVADALVEAMDAAFVNLPDLGGTVCIGPDVSGSMSGPISRMTKVRYIDIAGIFAGALLKANPHALVLPFENKVVSVKLSARDSLMTNADKLAKIGGGGTAVSAPISDLLDRKIKVDTFIGITDNIEWATDQSGRHGFLPAWYEYKDKIAPNAQAFLLTIAPYRHAVAPQDSKDIYLHLRVERLGAGLHRPDAARSGRTGRVGPRDGDLTARINSPLESDRLERGKARSIELKAGLLVKIPNVRPPAGYSD